jgi:hypothetical protein
VSWLDGDYRGRRITLSPDAVERGVAVVDQQRPRVVRVSVRVSVIRENAQEETVTQEGGPKLTAAWLRALADELDPAVVPLHGGGTSICR